MTVEKIRSGDVNQDTYYKYKYDHDGQIIERWQSSRPDFARSSLATYLYDKNEKLTKQIFRDIGGNFQSTTTYSYNKLGTLEYIRYGNDNWLKHDYGKQNNLVKKSHNYYFVNYTYNDKNQLEQETLFYNSPDTVSTTWFYYDKKGNKVQEIKKQFDNGETDTVNFIYNDVTNLVAYSVQGLDTLILKYEFY